MNPVIHFEVTAKDPERAKAFYEQALGWTISSWDGPVEYLLVTTRQDGEPGIDGAIMRSESGFSGVITTVMTDELDASLAKVKAAGGSVFRDKHAVPGVGWIGYCHDTEGNLFGLMQSDENAS